MFIDFVLRVTDFVEKEFFSLKNILLEQCLNYSKLQIKLNLNRCVTLFYETNTNQLTAKQCITQTQTEVAFVSSEISFLIG